MEMMVARALSESDLAEIRGRCDQATPGPWVSYVEGRDHTSGSSFIMTGTAETQSQDIELSGATVADQDFVANARQDVPRLIEEIERLKRIVEGV